MFDRDRVWRMAVMNVRSVLVEMGPDEGRFVAKEWERACSYDAEKLLALAVRENADGEKAEEQKQPQLKAAT